MSERPISLMERLYSIISKTENCRNILYGIQFHPESDNIWWFGDDLFSEDWEDVANEINNSQLATMGRSKLIKIISLDNNGNPTIIWDRSRLEEAPMPKLETGMFISIKGISNNDLDDCGVIVGEKIIYQKGGWDYINVYSNSIRYEDSQECIISIYQYADCFNALNNTHLIWSGKAYY